MKLTKFTYDTRQSELDNAISSAMSQTLGYAKIYELLHKQIWRKIPSRIWTYINPKYTHHNGRAVVFIRGWNIKSPYSSPYSYTGGLESLGLNQLFVGQDYRKPYVGSPKNGIYHDDCFIQPKQLTVTSGYINAWSYYSDATQAWDDGGFFSYAYTYNPSVYYAEDVDNNGQSIVTNAVYETYMDGAITKHRVIQTNANGNTQTIDLGIKTDPNSGIHFAQVRAITGAPKTYVYHFDLTGHGVVVHEEYSTPSWSWNGVSDQGWTKCYEDGTVIQYNPETYDMGDSGGSSPAHYMVLPMMYTDTGDLAMDKVEFVEKWNDYFELIVHEDSEWWQSFVTPILAIITVVVAAYTGIIFTPIGAIGTALSVVGTLGGDSKLQAIGGIMMAGAGISSAIKENAAQTVLNNASPSMSIGAARDIVNDMTFQQLFSTYTSGAGLTNWLNIGSKALSIASSAVQLSTTTTITTTTSEESYTGMRLEYKDEETKKYDPESVILLPTLTK